MPAAKTSKTRRKKAKPFYSRLSKLQVWLFVAVFAILGGYLIYKAFAYNRIAVNRPAVAILGAGANSKYWIVTDDGGIFSEGGAKFYGSTGSTKLAQPITSAAVRPQYDGYWLQGGDCGVFAFGGAAYYGHYSQTAQGFCRAIVATPSGKGYWQISQYGHIFEYGDAKSYSAAIDATIKKVNTGGFGIIPGLPSGGIVAAARTVSGKGLVLLASNGATYAYGDATYRGNAKIAAGQKATAIAMDNNNGYLVAASDGAVYGLGATYRGGANTLGKLAGPVVSVAMTPDFGGYWELGQDGGVFTYGNAVFQGNVEAPTTHVCWDGKTYLSTQTCPPQPAPAPSPSSGSGSSNGGSGTQTAGGNASGSLTPQQVAAQEQAIAAYKKNLDNSFGCGSFGINTTTCGDSTFTPPTSSNPAPFPMPNPNPWANTVSNQPTGTLKTDVSWGCNCRRF